MKISTKHLQKQFARVGRVFTKQKFEMTYSELGYSKLNGLESSKKIV